MEVSALRVQVSLLGLMMVLCGLAHAQTAATAQPTDSAGICPADTVITAELRNTLDTRRVHVGQPVLATVSSDVHCGDTVFARGTHLLGHVTQVSPAGEGQRRSSLGLIFYSAVSGKTQRVPLRAGVVRVAYVAKPATKTAPSRSDEQIRLQNVAAHTSIAAPASNPESTEERSAGDNLTGSNGVKFAVAYPAPGNALTGASLFSAEDGNLRLDAGTRLELKVSAAPAEQPAEIPSSQP